MKHSQPVQSPVQSQPVFVQDKQPTPSLMGDVEEEGRVSYRLKKTQEAWHPHAGWRLQALLSRNQL